jgi:hypothetical protein
MRRKKSWALAEQDARRFCRKPVRPFRNDAELLEAVWVARQLGEADWSELEMEDDGLESFNLQREVRDRLFECIRRSSTKLHLVRVFQEHKLTRLEQEILLVLVVGALGMSSSVDSVEEAQSALMIRGRDRLDVARALTPEGRLARVGLIEIEERGGHRDRGISVAPETLAPLLQRKGYETAWKVKTQDELLDRCFGLVRKLVERSGLLGDEPSLAFMFANPDEATPALTRAIIREFQVLQETLHCHPKWSLKELLSPKLSRPEQCMLLALLGKDLGFVPPHDDVFTGAGLARCASNNIPEVRHSLEFLRRDRPLRNQDYIRVCGGFGDSAAVEDEATLRSCEFELTDEFLAKLKVRRQRKEANKARQAVVKPSQLILSQQVRQALDMAIVQAKHSKVLLDKWGLREAIPYGRAVTVLFSGPPGVGKTASAEAMAYQLGKPIMVIDYSEIQNCWVGETEKNIVRAFREAREANAVLFWDEADAMFYDRDSAYRNWEVRDVNVLLQELERFDGLCILATNRKLALDKALERRISLKVEFEPPDRPMRKQIWGRLVPKKLPVSPDVDFDKLSEPELTGGEIKNAVLNAARLALARNPDGQVTMADFRKAIEMETQGRWHDQGGGRVGFRA